MKTTIITGMLAVPLLFSLNSNAQESKKEDKKKDVHITIVTNENGKATTIDTVFHEGDEAAMESFMKSHNIDEPPAPPEPPDMADLPEPPPPPRPPRISHKDGKSYSYTYVIDDNDDDLYKVNFDSKEINESIEKAMESVNKALESANFNSSDFKRDMKQLKEELNDLKKELKSSNKKNKKEKNKKVIIEKTGYKDSKEEREVEMELANARQEAEVRQQIAIERRIEAEDRKAEAEKNKGAEKRVIIIKKEVEKPAPEEAPKK